MHPSRSTYDGFIAASNQVRQRITVGAMFTRLADNTETDVPQWLAARS